ncbi:ABC transporter substrate-binding protein [Castellaniella sp.]|uniref:ABC transporter substrate-binding protein n=1 Tax=Castellaniella sp. TaxID=1955812 RepID=UPI002AFDC9CA|nr:ABC transporter substrate-binding protein [Castellaniella sp.]
MISRRSLLSLPWACAAAVAAPSRVLGQVAAPLTIGLSLRPESLDPTRSAAAVIGEVVHGNVLEGLTCIQENGVAAPLLAERWDVSLDCLRYQFRLRKGVVFHDGAKLDAGVAASSLRRAQALGAANNLVDTFHNIQNIQTPDERTVLLTLQYPDPLLPFRLGQPPAVIVHPATADQASRRPIGTGPYRFAGWRDTGDIDLVQWPGYRDASRIRIPAARFHFIPDPEQQIQAVLGQRVDVLFGATTSSVDRLRDSRHYEVLVGSSSGKGMVAINHRRAPLDDVRVRRAITHAIDREAFIREVLHQRAQAIGSHFAPTDPDYINLTGLCPYDPDLARDLLRAAGVRTPLTLDLALPPTPYALLGGPVVARYLAAVGIQVNLVQVSWARWMSTVFQGDFELSMITHVEPLDYGIYTRPDFYFGYDSADFRALVARHAASPNPREQGQLFRQIQRHLAQDAVNAWMFCPSISTVVRKGLKGLPMNYPVFAHDIGAMYWT